MKKNSMIVGASIFSQILTVGLPAGLFSNNTIAANNTVASNTAAASNPQESSSTTQTNIRGQLQPTSASAPVDKGWFFDASFLYWNAKVDGYNFANKIKLKGLNPGGVPTSVTAKAHIESPNFDSWDPGVQVGVGYIFPQREQWRTRLSWTHLNTDNHHTESTNFADLPNEYLATTLAPFVIGTIADRAAAHWSLHYNILDLELDRQFFVGKWLSFKPRIGLRAAWINQHFRTKYHSFFVTTADTFPFHNSFQCNQEFSGIGLKFGSDVQFYMTKAWSILGNLSTSLLWGSTELKQKVNGQIFPTASTFFPETVKVKQSIDKIKANLEGQLGLQWQTYYHQGKYRFATSALYTFSYWFSQNNLTNQIIGFPPVVTPSFPAIDEVATNGDLQLQGLNLQFEFDF